MGMIQDSSARQHRLLALSAATAIALAFFALGALWHGYTLLEKYPPDWTVFGWARTAICTVTAILLFVGLKPGRKIVHTGSLLPVEQAIFRRAFPAVMFIFLSATAVVLFAPKILIETARDTQSISIGTELILAAALLFMVLATRRAISGDRGNIFGIKGAIAIAAMALAVALLLAEEMSRGQHWLAFGDSNRFQGNLLGEPYLRSLFTYRFEFIYYSAAVLLFVILPYCWPERPRNWSDGLSFYVPPRAFAIIGLPACGLVFEDWNVIPYQIWFFLGLLIAVDLAVSPYLPQLAYRIGAAVLAALLFSSQFVFLVQDPNTIAGQTLSEIREFAISIPVLVYASWLFAKAGYEPSRPKQIQWD